MRTTLFTLLLAGVAATAFGAPAHAATPQPCKTIYCATLPDPEERLELVAYLADQKGARISGSSVACDAQSGAHRTGCIVLQGLVADVRRATVYSELAKTWSSTRRVAFARLLVAEEAFARAVGDNETDHMSADAGADAIVARQAEKAAFLTTLTRMSGDRASLSLVDVRVGVSNADGALNTAYAQVMAVEDTSNLAWGSVEKEGIKRTQDAWLMYRDAFTSFAATRDPALADAVRTELTTRRTVSLEGFLED